MYMAHSWRNVLTRFGAVALSVEWVASDAILRLNALYTWMGTLLFLDRRGTRRRLRSSSKVPVMVERGKVAVPVFPSGLDTVGTGLRYEEGKYSGPMVLVLNLKVAQFSFVTLVLYVRGPCIT
jgi:hypothetical protein